MLELTFECEECGCRITIEFDSMDVTLESSEFEWVEDKVVINLHCKICSHFNEIEVK